MSHLAILLTQADNEIKSLEHAYTGVNPVSA